MRGENQFVSKGFINETLAFLKSRVLRVATVRLWAIADAAIRLSLIGMAWPLDFRWASRWAHDEATLLSKSRQRALARIFSNHNSSFFFLLLAGRSIIPYSSSPKMTGVTARCSSWSRSHSTTCGAGSGLVGSLSTLASVINFTVCPWIRRGSAQTSLSQGRMREDRPSLDWMAEICE